ncbi:MAG: hypothetical protein HY329_12975 [Chloroflexi bacterium]|nr:hypothetical protein [Chloroflexota bacterium]
MITEPFQQLARSAAASAGLPDLPFLVLPGAFETLEPDTVRSLVDRHFDELLAQLGASPGVGQPEATRPPAQSAAWPAPAADQLDVADFYAWSLEQRAGDGLPVIAPTPDLVASFVAASRRPADDVLAVLPPRWGAATVEKIAANAVMAGCLPEYAPVVLGAVAGMGDPALDLESISTTTNPGALMVMVGGPICQRLGINGSYGCLGPGWRANATIGRAVALIQRNIGGMLPGEVSSSTHAQPGRYTFCLAENEEESPWSPYRADLGFGVDESTVTVVAVISRCSLSHRGSLGEAPEDYLNFYGAAAGPLLSEVLDAIPRGLLFCVNPTHARRLAEYGWGKWEVRERLYVEANSHPVDRYTTLLRRDLERRGLVVNGRLSVLPSPAEVTVWVAGGSGGHHSVLFSTRRESITRHLERSD